MDKFMIQSLLVVTIWPPHLMRLRHLLKLLNNNLKYTIYLLQQNHKIGEHFSRFGVITLLGVLCLGPL